MSIAQYSAQIITVLEPDASTAPGVLVIGSSEVVRSGLRAMLASLPEVASVQEGMDSDASLRLLASGMISVVLVSAPLAAEDYGAISEAAGRGSARVLVLLRDYGMPDRDLIAQAVALPADGYILESGLTQASLEQTLRQLDQGQAPMPALLGRGLVTRLAATEARMADRPFLLTARERQVLSLMVDGRSNKEIARHLRVSEHGAKRHVAFVLAKLNCPNRTAAVALVLQQGFSAQR